MGQDPIIKKVRQIRLSIEEECHNDSEEILRHAIEIQNKYPDRLVSKPPHSKSSAVIFKAKFVSIA